MGGCTPPSLRPQVTAKDLSKISTQGLPGLPRQVPQRIRIHGLELYDELGHVLELTWATGALADPSTPWTSRPLTLSDSHSWCLP